MRAGDLSGSPTPIYDPSVGCGFNPANPNAYARDRIPFPNNQIPQSRFSGPARKILALPDWPLPNAPGQGALGINLNYLAAINYEYDRDQIDSKVNFNLTDKWTAFTRLSYLKYKTDNPPPFGQLAGPGVHPTDNRVGNGFGSTYSGTVSTTYVRHPNLVFDGYFGAMLLDTNALFPDMDKNIARDVLGIPGTNGDTEFAGGMVRMPIDGFSCWATTITRPSSAATTSISTWQRQLGQRLARHSLRRRHLPAAPEPGRRERRGRGRRTVGRLHLPQRDHDAARRRRGERLQHHRRVPAGRGPRVGPQRALR